MAHPAESTHWYTRSGEPAYTVKAKDGTDRPTTLRDARKLNLVPSVTSVIRCAAAPGLEIWKSQQVLLAALTLPKVAGETEKAYLDRIMADSKAQAEKARERGTAIHAAIQGVYQDETPTPRYEPHIQGAIKAVEEWDHPATKWTAERPFACTLGFGGKCDLSSRAAVIDFKTKEFSEGENLKTWDEHAMQLAAYRHGLGTENARCAIVYVSTTVPGLAKLIEIPADDLAQGWTMFHSLLHYWQAKSAYRSSFEREAIAA